MKIILTDGTELNPVTVTGSSRHINGSSRDTLTFVFPEDTSLDELDGIFTDANCETIKLYENTRNEDGTTTETEYIHTGYTIRVELSRTPMVVQPATEDAEEIVENRVAVSMGLRTYAEKQLAKLIADNALHEECIVELASVIYA